MKKLLFLGLMVGLFFAPPLGVNAQEGTRQDQCLGNTIVNPETGSGCVEPNNENDPNNCSQLGSSDEIEQCLGGFSGPCNLDQTFLGLPTWYKYLDTETDPTGRCSPTIEDASSALPIGIAILEGMIRLGGLVAVVMVFVGAFKFITTQGNGEAAASARRTIINALIGLVIIIISTATVSFIGNSIG